ncbi:MAG: LysM peptidoglycan-binding domain-containing protein [Bacteroidetes bacterium]|nr:LysM peptidoglycan-binding domain-containing protein [Bacteroidota bacterium]
MKQFLFILLLAVISVVSVAQPCEQRHKVKRGETLYSISKEYGLKPEDLVKVNPSIEKKMKVRLGQKITIPCPPKVLAPVVFKRDTMPIIEKVTVNPSDATTHTGSVTPKAATSIKLKTASGNSLEYPSIYGQYASGGFKLKKNRGAANFIDDYTSGNPYLAFYNDAETGSIVRVVNPMNKKTTYVKVVGKLPISDTSREIIIKLSNKAANDLGAVDNKFLVEVFGYQQ